MKRSLYFLKHNVVLEFGTPDIHRSDRILVALDHAGHLQRYLGRNLSLLNIGMRAPRTEEKIRQHMEGQRGNVAHQTFYATTILTGLVNPNRKFKAKTVTGEKLFQGNAVTMQYIFRDIMVPDTPEGKTWSPLADAVIPVVDGPDAGSSTLTYFNDKKGAYTDSGKKRLTDGPCWKIVQKFQGRRAAYWADQFMREELKMHNDSVNCAMLSFSDESRAFVEEST